MRFTCARSFVLVLLSCLAVAAPACAEERTYLMAVLSAEGTTFAEMAVLFDPDVRDREACEREVRLGRRGNWQYYGHVVGRVRGTGTSNYTCLQTAREISPWLGGCCYKYNYLVDRRTAHVAFRNFDTFAACTRAARRIQARDDANLFCARSNQAIGPEPDAPRPRAR